MELLLGLALLMPGAVAIMGEADLFCAGPLCLDPCEPVHGPCGCAEGVYRAATAGGHHPLRVAGLFMADPTGYAGEHGPEVVEALATCDPA